MAFNKKTSVLARLIIYVLMWLMYFNTLLLPSFIGLQ